MSIKELLTRILKCLNRPVIYKAGSATVNAAQSYTLATTSALKPYSKYLILGYVDSTSGQGTTVSCTLGVSGTVTDSFGGQTVRTVMTAGGGLVNWMYVETGSDSVTASVYSYGYYTTSHTERGRILCIQIGGGVPFRRPFGHLQKEVAPCL